MNLNTFCSELGFDEKTEQKLAPIWETVCQNTTEDVPFFMKRDFYEKYYPLCNGPDGVQERMDQVACVVKQNPYCARFANILHYALFVSIPQISVGFFPLCEKCFGENAGIFQLMIAISSLPLIAETHKKMGLPEHFLRDTATWIGGTITIYAAAHHGIPGHTLAQTYWLRFHIDGRLFRIGRLEYLLGGWPEWLPAVYKHKTNGKLAVLCRDGWTFDRQGRLFENLPEKPAYTTHLTCSEGKVRGNAVHPDGTVEFDRETVLHLSEWEELVSAWDMVPGMHIPGGGGMNLQTLKNSMIEAQQFFLKYFRTDVKAFVCNSWIFNPAWEKMLPDSNLAAFQRNVYRCVNQKYKDNCGLFFVYGDNNCDPRTMPQKTALHKAFCTLLDRKEPLTGGSVFICTKDLEKFGKQTYR